MVNYDQKTFELEIKVHKNQKGLTLIELLVVIVIWGLLRRLRFRQLLDKELKANDECGIHKQIQL